jgi:glycerol kinase
MQYILSIDCGTTSIRTILFDKHLKSKYSHQQEINLNSPANGIVEQDPSEIWRKTQKCLKNILTKTSSKNIIAAGITNQRESFLLWDKNTGKPLTKIISWQDSRSEKFCNTLKKHNSLFTEKTGLPIAPYFSGSKLSVLLKNNLQLKNKTKLGEVQFGTLDTWLVYKLTGNHLTDHTNASRTLMYNIHTLDWDKSLCKILKIPLYFIKNAMPEVLPSNANFGEIKGSGLSGVKIHGIIGDQQGALMGQNCTQINDVKNTYGTGCFTLKKIGTKFKTPPQGILGTIAWNIDGETTYAWEGSVKVAGAVMQYLRDNLHMLKEASESEKLAQKYGPNEDLFFIPTFTGIGSPYWIDNSRGALLGLSLHHNKNHIIVAALESLAYQSLNLIELLKPINEIKLDGGASKNKWLMQFQADLLQSDIFVSAEPEATARGAAFCAGLGIHIFSLNNPPALRSQKISKRMNLAKANGLKEKWNHALETLVYYSR